MQRQFTERLATGAVVAIALATSATLHLGMLSGLSQERGLEPAKFAERDIPSDQGLPMTIRFQDPFAAEGRATVQCRSDGRGRVSDCKWLSESAAGWGDEAVERLNNHGKIYSPEGRIRGPVTFELSMCVGLCPVY